MIFSNFINQTHTHTHTHIYTHTSGLLFRFADERIFRQFLVTSKAASAPRIPVQLFCPYPMCNNSWSVPEKDSSWPRITCKQCKNDFCNLCLSKWHSVGCDQQKYLLVNPKCRVLKSSPPEHEGEEEQRANRMPAAKGQSNKNDGGDDDDQPPKMAAFTDKKRRKTVNEMSPLAQQRCKECSAELPVKATDTCMVECSQCGTAYCWWDGNVWVKECFDNHAWAEGSAADTSRDQ